MDRRSFGKWLSLATPAALGAWPAWAQAADVPQPQQGSAPGGSVPESTTAATAAAGPARQQAVAQAVAIEDLRQLAQQTLSRPVYDYIATGSADQVTVRENLAAFRRIQLVPPLLTGVQQADLSTRVLGDALKLPILLAPVAAQRLYHPDGALAAARAAAGMGTLFGVSSSAFHRIEEIAAASPCPKWLQVYLPRDRQIARQLVHRAEQSGYRAIVLTVDQGEQKDADKRNRFRIPREMLIRHLRDYGFTQVDDRWSDEQLADFNTRAWDLTADWSVIPWLRAATKLPIILKGVLRPADARKAVEAGVAGIVVSNHGGRRLDGMPATIDMLPGVVQAVQGRAEVYLDSGIRRGTDVLKALALGARAVLIGRPYAWGLAAGGEAGVRRALEILRDELELALVACGAGSLSELRPDLLRQAPGAAS